MQVEGITQRCISATMVSSYTKLLLPLALGCFVSLSVLVFSELSHHQLDQANQLIASSIEAQAVTSQLLTLVTDAETAQRGFLLTEQRKYLEPYMAALPQIDPKLKRLRELTEDNPQQREKVLRLANLIGEKITELEAVLALYRKAGAPAAQALVETDVGRRTMDAIRDQVAGIQTSMDAELVSRSSRWNVDVAWARFGMTLITVLNLVLVGALYVLARRDIGRRERIRRTLEDKVRERTAELSELSSNLQNVQEQERARLAHDIHDELGSILVTAKMDLSWVHRRLKDQDAALSQKLARAIASLDEGVDIKRRLIDDLRPTILDSLGLGAAVEWYVNSIAERSKLRCAVSINPAEMEVSSAISIALFRVLQEAMTNILRHAHATNAWITLERQSQGLTLVIRDDGIGLSIGAERNKLSHGIWGMRQRVTSLGGQFEIGSGLGTAGTTIRIFVPVAPTVSSLGRQTPALS